MPDTLSVWKPRSAWAGIVKDKQVGAEGKAGITARLLDGYGLASLIAGPGDAPPLAALVQSRLGLVLPATPLVASGPAHDAIWSGPGQWLLRAASRGGFEATLSELSPLAAVSDQSDARAGLRLSGPQVRQTLAKGVMLDLHPAAFAVGQAALTSVSYIGIHLWRLPDGPDGPVFEIMAPRSQAGSFWSWFSASAAEFGCAVVAGRG